MEVVAGVNRFISLILDTIKELRQGRIWLLLLGYFLLNGLLLQAHHSFLSPVFYEAVKFWTGLFGDRQAVGFTHYPGHFLLLPYFFGWARFFVGLLVEGAVLGAVALMLYQGFLTVPREERASPGTVLSLWIHLVLAWTLINGLILLVNLQLPSLLEPWLAGSPRRIMAFQFVVVPFIYAVILAVLFLVIPRIAVYREAFHKALKRAVRTFWRNPITCFCLSVAVLAVPVFISLLVGRAADIVEKFRPELVYWLLLAGVAADVISYFFWMGTAVRLLVHEET